VEPWARRFCGEKNWSEGLLRSIEILVGKRVMPFLFRWVLKLGSTDCCCCRVFLLFGLLDFDRFSASWWLDWPSFS